MLTTAHGHVLETVQVRRATDGALIHSWQPHPDEPFSVAFSPDSSILVTSCTRTGGDDVRLWRVADWSLILGINTFASMVAFSPDGELLALAGRVVEIRRVSDGALLHALIGHRPPSAECVAFSPDGATLASGGTQGEFILWRVADGELLQFVEAHTNNVGSVDFSPDGETLATGGFDRTIKLWRVSDGSPIRTIPARQQLVYAEYSPDGETLLSNEYESGGRSIGLWRVSDGTPLLYYDDGLGQYSKAAQFSSDGLTFACGGPNAWVGVARNPLAVRDCPPDASLSLRCKPARSLVVAKLSGLAVGETVTVNASCDGSKNTTANDRGRAKAKFKNVDVTGCEITVTECPNLVDACP